MNILTELKNGNYSIFEILYKQHYYLIENMVCNNSGDDEDAKEIFQETMIALFKNVRDNKITNDQVEISTYIYAIARNKWLTKLKKNKTTPIEFTDNFDLNLSSIDNSIIEDEEIIYDEKSKKVSLALNQIKTDCKTIIIDSFYKKLSNATIALQMGYTEAFIKVKKYRCMEMLKKLVQTSLNIDYYGKSRKNN